MIVNASSFSLTTAQHDGVLESTPRRSLPETLFFLKCGPFGQRCFATGLLDDAECFLMVVNTASFAIATAQHDGLVYFSNCSYSAILTDGEGSLSETLFFLRCGPFGQRCFATELLDDAECF